MKHLLLKLFPLPDVPQHPRHTSLPSEVLYDLIQIALFLNTFSEALSQLPSLTVYIRLVHSFYRRASRSLICIEVLHGCTFLTRLQIPVKERDQALFIIAHSIRHSAGPSTDT